jgi:predicted metal-binding membrane protein
MRRNWLVPIMGGLIGTTWITLLLWSQSPYARYLDHGRWTDTGVAICRVIPGGIVLFLLYVIGWLLMSAAMMLPTALPLLHRFDHMMAARADRVRLVALLISGYLLVWFGFGVLAHLADALLHILIQRWLWLTFNAWIVGVGVLMVAGGFQFSRLKYHCLDKCRTPLSFIIQHWHGQTPYRDALLLGMHHGVFCVGCCWAIMLLMFVVGTGNVGWMLALGIVMAIEKNAVWGRRLSHPMGYGLFVGASVLCGANL